MIQFEERDIEFIITNIIIPCFKEYSAELAKTTEKIDQMQFELFEQVMDIISVKFKEMEIENLSNLSFIKAVLFANKLTNDECYTNYINEWSKLNREVIKELKTGAIRR